MPSEKLLLNTTNSAQRSHEHVEKNKLQVSNPDHITYQTDQLGFAILGGVKLEGLDRLRVTLKVEVVNRKIKHYLNQPELADLALRHNLDLYNDTQVERLVRKAAERLEVSVTEVAKAIAEITSQLEQYRLVEREREIHTENPIIKLNESEVKAAQAFLESPNLLEKTNAFIGQSGVVGEDTNRLLMYLIFTSRKMKQPLHILSLGASGTGKTHLQEKVGELIPQEDKIELTTLSENAFYYFERRALAHKLILIEDLDGAEGALYPLRELQSKKRISKTVAHKNSKGDTRSIHLVVEGPVSVAGCTTKERIYEDNANRSFLIYLDESPQQDKRIMDYQRAMSAGKVNEVEQEYAKEILRNSQRLLTPVKVVNPFAENLQIPPEVFKPRRTNAHYLAFIELVTFYHQAQREQKVNQETGEVYIETTLADIEAANGLLKEVLLRKSDELSGACRNYFERLKGWLKETSTSIFTNQQARAALKESHSNQKKYMVQLQQNYLVRKSKGNRKAGYAYQVVSMEEYKNLRKGISNALDKVLEVVQSSPVVQRPVEPLQTTPTKQNSQKFQSSPKGYDREENLQSPTRQIRPNSPGASYTLQLLRKAMEDNPNGPNQPTWFSARDVMKMTGRALRTENGYLRQLNDQGLLERKKEYDHYVYRISDNPNQP